MLFVIGNGFDIALGLKTSYKDFLVWYLKQKTDDKEILKLKNSIRKDLEKNNLKSWADLEMKLGSYTSQYGESIDECMRFTSAYYNIKENLNKHLKLQENKINNNINLPTIIKDVRTFFVNFYDDFPAEIISDLEPRFKNAKSKIKYDFATFNYTKTLRSCLDLKNKIINQRPHSYGSYDDYINKIEFIHGEIDNIPVMGVDNETQIANEFFRKQENIKLLLLKPHLNQEMQDGIIGRICNLINDSSVICIFGSSIGNSDIFWWKKLGEWLINHSSKRLVIFWYEDEKTRKLHGDKRILIENKVRRNFIELANIDILKYSELKGQIHVHVHDKIFKTKFTSRKKK